MQPRPFAISSIPCDKSIPSFAARSVSPPSPKEFPSSSAADREDEIAFCRSRLLLYSIVIAAAAIGLAYYFYLQQRL